jgi:hypothetical protein
MRGKRVAKPTLAPIICKAAEGGEVGGRCPALAWLLAGAPPVSQLQ